MTPSALAFLLLLAASGASAQEPPADTQALASGEKVRVEKLEVDGITDGLLISSTWLASIVMEAIIRSGEIEAQAPDDEAELGFLDRWILDVRDIDDDIFVTGDMGLLLLFGWAATDTVLGAVRTDSERWQVNLAMYMESIGITWALTNLAKIAVRRPRPRAYIELRDTSMVTEDTQEALSFWSLHTAIAASFAGTASYLAFTRDGPKWERWVVLCSSIGMVAFVGGARMVSAAHFTTDVLTGAMVGATVGILVPHLHRKAPNLGISAGPAGRGGGSLLLHGKF